MSGDRRSLNQLSQQANSSTIDHELRFGVTEVASSRRNEEARTAVTTQSDVEMEYNEGSTLQARRVLDEHRRGHDEYQRERERYQEKLKTLQRDLEALQRAMEAREKKRDLDIEDIDNRLSLGLRIEETELARIRQTEDEVDVDDDMIERVRRELKRLQLESGEAATTGTQAYEEEGLDISVMLAIIGDGTEAQHMKRILLTLGGLAEESRIPITGRGSLQPLQQEQIRKALYEPYRYQGLDSSKEDIRLVRVHANGGPSGQINCNLEHHNLRDLVGNRFYDAISYVWGSSARTDKVLCDDHTSHLCVTTNLRNILEKLALEPSKFPNRRPYWIDGICINQEDEQERGHQVRKMANIYRRAARVHIFLGAFSTSQPILQSQWLARRWVIQEAVAAQTAVVHLQRDGEWEQLAWRDFVGVVNDGRSAGATELRPAANLLRGLAETKATRWSGIFPLLLKFHATECYDDRDRLYALLGVSSDVELKDKPEITRPDMAQFQAVKIWFQPSYTLSTAQVYHKFALAAVRSLFAFDILHCAGAFCCTNVQDATDTPLPSWVPNWRYSPRYKPLLRAIDCRAGILQGAGRKKTPGQVSGKHVIVIEGDNTLIAIKGLMIGKVDCFIDPSSEPDKVPLYHTVKVEWLPDPIDLNSDRIHVLLDSGFTAYVPKNVRLGDEVVIPIGARTPFVLREVVRTDQTCYKLIGDCFVLDKDVMDGTYIRPLVNSPFTEFHIM